MFLQCRRGYSDLSKQLKTSVPGGQRQLPRGSVHYSTIWIRLQKLRLLTSCLTQKVPLLYLLLEIISKTLLTFPRKVEGSKWIYPTQREAVVLMEICHFKTPKAVRGHGLLPLPKFSFLERPVHTYPLLSAFPNSPPRFASSLQVQVPGLSPSKTRHQHSKHTSVAT